MWTHPEMLDENGNLVPDENWQFDLKYDTTEDNDEED